MDKELWGEKEKRKPREEEKIKVEGKHIKKDKKMWAKEKNKNRITNDET